MEFNINDLIKALYKIGVEEPTKILSGNTAVLAGIVTNYAVFTVPSGSGSTTCNFYSTHLATVASNTVTVPYTGTTRQVGEWIDVKKTSNAASIPEGIYKITAVVASTSFSFVVSGNSATPVSIYFMIMTSSYNSAYLGSPSGQGKITFTEGDYEVNRLFLDCPLDSLKVESGVTRRLKTENSKYGITGNFKVDGIEGTGGIIASEIPGTNMTIDSTFGKSPTNTTITDLLFSSASRINNKGGTNTITATGKTSQELSKLGYVYKDKGII